MSLENNTETKDKDSEASSPTPQANQDQTGLKDVEDQPTSTPPSSPRNMEPWAWILLITSVLSSIFLFALDNTIVADVQPRVVKELGEIDKLPWISVAFAACGVSTNLMWGKLYGVLNTKSLFIFNVILFEIGSAICGAAPTMNAFIVGRAICGVGGVGIYLGALSIVAAFTSLAERPVYMGLTAVTWGLGTVLGPIVGGAFATSKATWRWSFYINLCIGAAAAPAFLFLLPRHNPIRDGSKKSRILKLDYIGNILFIGAIVSGVMAISFGGALYAWGSAKIIGLFCCSSALWILFFIQQGFRVLTTPVDQIFPVYLVKNWEMDILFAQTACAVTALFVTVYFIPIFFEFVKNDSALTAGVRLLPFIIPHMFSVILNGVIMGKTGWYMPWYLAGGILCVAGAVPLYTSSLDVSAARTYGWSILVGVGCGAYSQASFSVAQAKADPKSVHDAVAFITCAQLLGVALALTISNSVFLNRATQRIGQMLPDVPRQTVQTAISGADAAFFRELTSDVRDKVLQATVKAIGDTYILVIASGAVTVVLALLMKRERLFVNA